MFTKQLILLKIGLRKTSLNFNILVVFIIDIDLFFKLSISNYIY